MGEPARAWSVKRLSEQWDCSPRHIYDLIDDGKLKAFSIGERSLRITDEERLRCENENVKSIDEEKSPSDGEEAAPLPTSAVKLLATANV